MKKIVVNDTNVFIDLYNIDLLEEFFRLPWEIHTTDFVISELRKEKQKYSIKQFVKEGKLRIDSFGPEQLNEILDLQKQFESKTNVSLTDCSVWYYAKTKNCPLLTGDRKLKSSSQKDGVEVHGIIYVFDSLLSEGILSHEVTTLKLKELQALNPRLPQKVIKDRLNLWESLSK